MIFSRISIPEGSEKVCNRMRESIDRGYVACKYDGAGGDESERRKSSGSSGTCKLPITVRQ